MWIPDPDLVAELGFRQAVYAVVERIPPGRVLGYGHVAAALGQPRAARQVGYALAALPPDSAVPWWRVVRSDGTIAMQGDPARGPRQIARLRGEGVVLVGGRVAAEAFGDRELEGPSGDSWFG